MWVLIVNGTIIVFIFILYEENIVLTPLSIDLIFIYQYICKHLLRIQENVNNSNEKKNDFA